MAVMRERGALCRQRHGQLRLVAARMKVLAAPDLIVALLSRGKLLYGVMNDEPAARFA